jgi:hypothetical protein
MRVIVQRVFVDEVHIYPCVDLIYEMRIRFR